MVFDFFKIKKTEIIDYTGIHPEQDGEDEDPISKEIYTEFLKISSSYQTNPYMVATLMKIVSHYYLMNRALYLLGNKRVLFFERTVDYVTCFPFLYDLYNDLYKDNYCLDYGLIDMRSSIELKLGTHNILAGAWRQDRLKNALLFIGDKKAHPWKKDSNHSIDFWYPLCMAWVNGGNHSITSGIFQDEGFIPIDSYRDMGWIYNYVNFDDDFYYVNSDKNILKKYRLPAGTRVVGSVFEMGRFINGFKVSVPEFLYEYYNSYSSNLEEALGALKKKHELFYLRYCEIEEKINKEIIS